jgi:hypothetical protein
LPNKPTHFAEICDSFVAAQARSVAAGNSSSHVPATRQRRFTYGATTALLPGMTAMQIQEALQQAPSHERVSLAAKLIALYQSEQEADEQRDRMNRRLNRR